MSVPALAFYGFVAWGLYWFFGDVVRYIWRNRWHLLVKLLRLHR
jgi:hypothetical protein